MIITITGKPCSGKGTVAKEFCKKYNFEYICTGDMFREYAKKLGYDNILTFQEEDPRVKEVDNIVDSSIEQLGKTKIWNFEYEELKNRKGLFDNKLRLIRNRDTNTLNKH